MTNVGRVPAGGEVEKLLWTYIYIHTSRQLYVYIGIDNLKRGTINEGSDVRILIFTGYVVLMFYHSIEAALV